MGNQSEQGLQKACAQILALHVPAPPRGPAWTAVNPVPAKSRAVAGVSKAMGLRAGWPDLTLIHKGRAILAELKTDSGRLSTKQRQLCDQITAAGGEVYLIRSLDDFLAMLETEGIPCSVRR